MSGKTAVSKEQNDRHRRLLQAAVKQPPTRGAPPHNPRPTPPPPSRAPAPAPAPARAPARAADLEGRRGW